MTEQDVTMVLSGDLYVQREDPESIFAFSAPYLRQADLFFGNLEAAVTDRGNPTPAKEMGLFKSEERMFTAYTSAGLGAVGVANNHTMNYGTDGLLRTFELLDGVGIAHTGGGRDIDEAHLPAIVERKGTKIAFLSYSSVFVPPFAATSKRGGIATVRVTTAYEPQPRLSEVPGSPPIIRTFPNEDDVSAMLQDVAKAKQLADVVVISWHWGLSPATGGAGQMVPYQQPMAHAAIDAGADLIVGHHPHVLQPIEVYKGKVIFYSLGNFAFDLFRGRAQTTVLAECHLRNGSIQQVGFLPTFINEDAQPNMVNTGEGATIVDHMKTISQPFGTVFEVNNDQVVINTASRLN
jgi:poly-gamma-glutamate capsule biosynthesis protein CapA/YwtB (metallophosphatase superfamily)